MVVAVGFARIGYLQEYLYFLLLAKPAKSLLTRATTY